jgi:heat shock protein HslJ
VQHRTSRAGARGRRRRLVAALVLALAAVTGCGDATVPVSGDNGDAGSGEDLEGRTYESTEVRGRDLVDGTTVTVSFAGGQLGASAGCNSMSGPARWHEGRLEVAGQLATTMIACPADLQAQDEWLAGLLTSSPSLSLAGSTLTIGEEPGLTLEEVADLPVEGTRWALESLVDGDSVSSVPTDLGAELTIRTDGTRLDVSTGCNEGAAPVTVQPSRAPSSGTLSVGALATTDMTCPQVARGIEAHVLAVLEGEVAYEVDGDRLTLTKDGLGLVLTGSVG